MHEKERELLTAAFTIQALHSTPRIIVVSRLHDVSFHGSVKLKSFHSCTLVSLHCRSPGLRNLLGAIISDSPA